MLKKVFGICVLVLVGFVICSGCQRPLALEKKTFDPQQIAWENRDIFRQGLIQSEQEVLQELPGATVYHLDLKIADDFTRLQGHEEVFYTNTEDTALVDIYFRLFPNAEGGKMTLTSVYLQDTEVEPGYACDDSAVYIELKTPLQPGEHTFIALDFEVAVPQTKDSNMGVLGYFENMLVLEHVYPAIPAYDESGWNLALPAPYTDFTYYDPSFYIVRITAPAGLNIATSGVTIAQEQQDDTQVINIAAGPVRDFYIAASEQFVRFSETIGETTVHSYGMTGYDQGTKTALELAVEALKYYNKRFGTYPYRELDVVSSPVEALGMEYPGIVVIGLAQYDLSQHVGGLPARVMLEATVLHEIAHQWFYNVVGNNQAQEPWLDEALVQYLLGQFYQHTYGYGAYSSFRQSWVARWNRVEGRNIPIGMPWSKYQGKEASAILYGRGPLFMEKLAERLGQEQFNTFLHDYYEQHKWGIATGKSFKALVEKHCHCDLTPLFEEWVYE